MDEASPRFRQDLVAAATETDGVPCVDVSDPATGTSFRFYDFEYQLALQLNGQPLGAVTAWASEAYGIDLTPDGVREFAGRLAELGFLESAAAAPAPAPARVVAPAEVTPPPAAFTPVPEVTAPAADSLDNADDNAEAEWMTTEGAQTATFIPDAAMFDSPGEPTPVAPDLPRVEAELAAARNGKLFDIPTAANKAPTREIPIPVVPEAAKNPAPPMRAARPPAAAAPAVAPPAAPTATTSTPGWATELDDDLQPGHPGAPTAPPMPRAAMGAEQLTPPPMPPPPFGMAPTPSLPPSSGPRTTGMHPVAAGHGERRQPPAPDAVQMTPFADDAAAAAKPRTRQTRTMIWVVLLLAAAGIGYLAWSRMQARTPEVVSVRVMSPRPAAVYRWFSGQGTVTDYETRTLSFPSQGTLAELLPSGSTFAGGEILGKLRGATPLEGLLARARARVSFYQQMRESMRTAGNHVELRQAEIKLTEKQRLVEEAAAALAKLTVRANEPGEIVETMAKVGGYVRAGAPLVRVKGRVLHGEFALDQDDAAIAHDLAFCRVEVVGLGPRASNAEARGASDTAADTGSPDAQAGPRFIDCTLAKDSGRDKLRVVLPANVGLVPGQPLRLARQRFDAVFPIPPALVSDGGAHKTVWVAGRGGVSGPGFAGMDGLKSGSRAV